MKQKNIFRPLKFTGKFISLAPILALALSLGNASAAVVAQSTSWTDAEGSISAPVVGFDVINANSILVATIYVDNTTPDITNVRFGDGNGIGTGDVAPTFTATQDGRLLSYLFINPNTASGLSFRLDSSTGNGIAAILYEVSGAKTSLASITALSGNTTITTSTAAELIVGFGGNNGTNDPSVNGSSIYTDEDFLLGNVGREIFGGGQLASASAIAPSIGVNDVTWSLAGPAQFPGAITYAFEAVPEPSAALLGALGALALLRRRR